MKLRTTALLASVGVLVSAAAAFAVPLSRSAASPDPSVPAQVSPDLAGARMTAGDTLLVDARLGHASLARGGAGETLLLAQVTSAGDRGGVPSAPPMNLGIVIDRSGSMRGERIANAMNAAALALERMRDGDCITVVAFDTASSVVVPPTRVSAATRPRIEAAIRSIRLGGDTCISCGLEEGMRQIASLTAGANGGDHVDRIVLLSDGATNAGVRDVPGLRAMAGRMFGRGVTISTIGVDVEFDEKVMAAIASEANGRHYFVANASGLPGVFAQEFDDVLASTARDAELALELAPGVEVLEVFDRSFRREGNRVLVPFGTFSAEQEKTVLVRLRVPTDGDGTQPVARVDLAYRDLVKKADGSCHGNLAVAVRSDGAEARELDPFVAARLERSRTAQTLTDANRLFEAGKVAEARQKLASRKTDLARTEAQALALAARTPAAAPHRSAKGLDRDFADQIGAVADAERSFAPAPAAAAAPAGGGGFAAPPPARDGRAQVRANQEAATTFGF